MLARSLIPWLRIPVQAPAPDGLDASAWLDQARRLEDEGADEILISTEAAGSVLVDFVGRLAEALSIPVISDAGNSAARLDACLKAGADKSVLEAGSRALAKAVQTWGPETVIARVHLERHANAGEAVEAGACALLASWSAEPDGSVASLRALADTTCAPVIAAGPFSAMEQVRRSLHEGRAEAVALPVCLLAAAHGVFEVKRYLAAAGIVVRGMS